MRKYLAYDTETGSLAPTNGSLLTVTFRVLDAQLQELETLELTTKPEDEVYLVKASALNVNKIDLVKHNETAITYGEARGKLLNFLNRHSDAGTNKLTPIGFVVSHDDGFVQTHLVTQKEWEAHVSHRKLDVASVVEFLKFCMIIPSSIGGLEKTAKFFGVHEEGAHNATVDVNMTLNVLKAAKRRICS